uniref:Gamma-interferon-inducible lysosomal thiol reductase n=1 Tax=Periophthalmus magnuspinnatus TaxID=409849 RepID=A0A3B3ZWI8_9GOBI
VLLFAPVSVLNITEYFFPECGAPLCLLQVLKQCMELRAVAPPPNAAPVSVSVFYQSLCPAWRHFLSQQLFPTWTMLRDILSVHLVPYSASKVRDAATTSAAPPTDAARKRHCHFSHRLSQNYIISCMESSADVVSAARACLHLYAPALSWASVQSCVNGSRGPLLVNRSGAAARALSPAPSHLPWVTFNGVYTDEQQDRAMSSLFTLVCQLYQVTPPAAPPAAAPPPAAPPPPAAAPPPVYICVCVFMCVHVSVCSRV